MLYVQASLLALHVTEISESPVSHWVRINTPVEVLDEEGEMVQIRLLDRPEAHPVTGWVKGSYLDTERLTVGDTWDGVIRARKDEDSEAETMWLERTLAINPLYSPARSEPAPQEAWLAMCEATDFGEGRAMLLGRVSEAGFKPDFHASPGKLRQLSAQHWLRLEGSQRLPIEGSPFVQPFGTEQWNESHRSAFEPGTCEGICTEDFQVSVLGPCEDIGALYSSSPVVSASEQAGSYASVESTQGLFHFWLGGLEMSTPVTWWEVETDEPPPTPDFRWIQVGEARYAIVRHGGNHWGGYQVFRVEGSRLDVDTVQLFGSGC